MFECRNLDNNFSLKLKNPTKCFKLLKKYLGIIACHAFFHFFFDKLMNDRNYFWKVERILKMLNVLVDLWHQEPIKTWGKYAQNVNKKPLTGAKIDQEIHLLFYHVLIFKWFWPNLKVITSDETRIFQYDPKTIVNSYVVLDSARRQLIRKRYKLFRQLILLTEECLDFLL